MQSYLQHVYTGFIHGQEVQPWHRFPYQKGWITILQAFPTDGVTNVPIEVRNTRWYRYVDAQFNWLWGLEFEVHNLGQNAVVYELWQLLFLP
jgi:hypothetical protein